MADMTRIKGRIAETIYPNGTGAITAESHQALLLEMVDDINEKKADKEEVTTVEESVSMLSQEVESNYINLTESLDALEQKLDNLPQGGGDFDPSGTYPNLTAGDLAGRGESVPAEFGFRASGGKSIKDGRAYIKRIKGNSVVWNQKIDKQYISQNSVITLRQGESLTTGHKYLLMRSQGGGGCYLLPAPDVYTYSLGDNQLSMIFNSEYSCTSEGVYPSYPHIYCTAESGYIQLIDLTQMFQAGNEPTTIEEFNARVATLGIDMYAYNEGQVIHCNTESIKSVGDNAWDEEWEIGGIYTNNGESFDIDHNIRSKDYNRIIGGQEYSFLSAQTGALILYDEHYNYVDYWNIAEGQLRVLTIADNAAFFKICIYDYTYKHGTMLRLNHSGWKSDTGVGYQEYWQDTLPLPIIRKYFPDGMKSAGSAHDEIRYNKATKKWEYSKGKIKSADLGDLDWSYYPAADGYPFGFLYASPQGRKYGEKNILCGKYAFGNFANDKSILGNSAEENIYIMDSAYTDAATFKASLQGVMFYYESNDWEWVELDAEDQNFRDYYQVADFGTEQSQSAVPSAAFSADIIYQFNAVDMIREHEAEITELQKVIATMQAQLTALTNGGQ